MDNIILTSISLEELANILIERLSILNSKTSKTTTSSKEIEKKNTKYLTRKQTAKLCKIKSLATLWNWKQQGKLVPKQKAGRKPLYLKSDVIDFLNGVNKNINN